MKKKNVRIIEKMKMPLIKSFPEKKKIKKQKFLQTSFASDGFSRKNLNDLGKVEIILEKLEISFL